MLRNEHRMPAVRGLTAVVTGLRRGEPPTDQLSRVLADRPHAALLDHASLATAESELRSKRVAPDAVKSRVQFVHDFKGCKSAALCPVLAPPRRKRERRTTRRYATAVPSSSTICPGTARRVTPSIVVVGATPAAPSRPASTP